MKALVLIDVQKGFSDLFWGRRNNPDLESRLAELLRLWRAKGAPIYHVQHLSTEYNSPLRPERPGVAFMDFAKPIQGELVIQKNVNSAFIGTQLEKVFREAGVEELVLAGFTTDHCVSTTTRMAANLGFKVSLSSDTTATFDRTDIDGQHYSAELVHRVSLASLNKEFATVVESFW
jgi:nicotinamidase-related amidase